VLGGFQLRPQEGRDQLARQQRRADVLPSVFVNLAAEEAAAIGALLANDFGAQAKGGIVHQQRAALTRHDVLGLVEGEAAEIADGAERRALVARHDAPRRILDDAQGVALGDRAGARGDGSLDPAFVEVERVLADVDENRDRAAQHEGIRRRDEGEGGHDDLVAAFEVEQDRGEVECGGAGRRQQRAGAAGAPFEPFVAAPGERPVALQMMALQSLLDTGLFLARDVGPMKGMNSEAIA
jgi:hypothetical protein